MNAQYIPLRKYLCDSKLSRDIYCAKDYGKGGFGEMVAGEKIKNEGRDKKEKGGRKTKTKKEKLHKNGGKGLKMHLFGS